MNKYKVTTKQRLITTAEIIDNESGEIVASGEAVLSPNDSNDPLMGREIATARAFKRLLPIITIPTENPTPNGTYVSASVVPIRAIAAPALPPTIPYPPPFVLTAPNGQIWAIADGKYYPFGNSIELAKRALSNIHSYTEGGLESFRDDFNLTDADPLPKVTAETPDGTPVRWIGSSLPYHHDIASNRGVVVGHLKNKLLVRFTCGEFDYRYNLLRVVV